MYQPQHLKLWTRPDHYAGEVWPGYYVFLSQHRDSDSLTRSNFLCGLEAIGGESETVQVVREGHWAVGWVEWIAIHQDDERALEAADEVARRLEGYPVVNEDHWGQMEWEEAQDYWASLPLSERVDMCRDAGLSIFAARHPYIPQDDNGYIFESLRS